MKIAKFLCGILALVLLLTCFVACGNDPQQPSETTVDSVTDSDSGNESNTETSNPDYDANGYWKDDLPEDLSFPGKTITILYWSDVERPEFEVKLESGELVNDAIYSRNETVQRRLGIQFEWVPTLGNYQNQDNFVNTAYNDFAGGNQLDILAGYSLTAATLAMRGISQNIKEIDNNYLNLDQPWWPDSVQTASTINDKLFFLTGDISTNMLHMMYSVFFNRDLQEEFQLEDPCNLVLNKTWTLDKMFAMAQNLYSDLDSNGKTNTDRFGFCTSSIHVDAFYCGAGLKYLEIKDNELIISNDLTSQKASDLVSKLLTWLHTTDDVFLGATATIFADNRVLFTMDRAYMADGAVRNTEIRYGILPVPKYDENQEDYVTILGFPYTLYSISKGSRNIESGAVTAVLECMGSEGYRQVTPKLFEITMKVRYNSDEAYAKVTSQMYDIIRDSIYIDPGRVFSTPLKNTTYALFRDEVYLNGGMWTSSVDAQLRSMRRNLEAINETYQ